MSYPYAPKTRGRSRSSFLGTMVGVGLLVIVFAVAVYEFRKPDVAQEETPIVPSIANVLSPLGSEGKRMVPVVRAVRAELFSVGSQAALGEAKRGRKNDAYVFEVTASLPAIDRETEFYEAWLVQPIPYDYFSAGEMVTNDGGEFVVEWEGEIGKSYEGYTRVVITRERYDGPAGPNTHVVAGEFRD